MCVVAIPHLELENSSTSPLEAGMVGYNRKWKGCNSSPLREVDIQEAYISTSPIFRPKKILKVWPEIYMSKY